MVKLVIYDFDGTLGDTFKLHLKAYAYCLEKFNIKATDSEIIKKCFNKTDSEAAYNFGIEDAESFSRYYRNNLLEVFKDIELYPDVVVTLEKLKSKKILLGIGTARNRNEMELVLNKLDIRKYFDVIVTHDEVIKKKPDPEVFLEICRQVGVDPSQSIVVGDSENDLIAANRMKARSILFYPKEHLNYYDINELNKFEPSFVIKNNSDIVDILDF